MRHRKRFLLLLLTLLIAVPACAQQKLKFSIASFELDPFDLTAQQEEHEKIDGSGARYAIIKVSSNNPDDDLRAFQFNFGNLNSKVKEHDTELWVYVQRNAKWVTISREGYTTVNRYDLKTTIQAGKVYAMQLSVAAAPVYTQMVQFTVQPAAAKAAVMIKSSKEGAVEELFGTTDEMGAVAKSLPLGTYTYRVVAESFYPSEGRFTLNDRTQTYKEDVTLRPNGAEVTLSVNADADIYINGEKKGRRTWTGVLKAETYYVECRQEGHRNSAQNITVAEGQPKAYNLPLPTPITGTLAVTSRPLGATITIDGKTYGQTPQNVTDLLIGQHNVTLSRPNYKTESLSFEIRENETRNLEVSLFELIDAEKRNAFPNSSMEAFSGSEILDKDRNNNLFNKLFKGWFQKPPKTYLQTLCPDSNHPHMIDLGLSVKWACCNVGALSPLDYGSYYAWGETENKEEYEWRTYKWCNNDPKNMTKYEKHVDQSKILELSDDVAQYSLGAGHRTPTAKEQKELIRKCDWTWVTIDSINGYKVTSKTTGQSIFLPATGYRIKENLLRDGSSGYYWSAEKSSRKKKAIRLSLFKDDFSISKCSRFWGFPIRSVADN